MNKVYIVTARVYRRGYFAEPFKVEDVIKVFDDYHKVVEYICDTIKKEHKKLDDSRDDLTCWHKYEPHPDDFVEGHYISSIEYDTGTYYESMSYKFRSYDVE